MLTQNLALDSSTGTEATFNLQSYATDGAVRIDVASDNSRSQFLEVRHTASGKGVAAIDRHLISAYAVELDGAGVPYKATVNLTIAKPRNAVFSTVEIADLVSYIVDLIDRKSVV